MSQNYHFRGCFDKQQGKRAPALFKSASHHIYHFHRSLPRKFSWKKFFLLTCQILGLLANTLATDEKYPVLNRDNLTIPIEMQLSQKQKVFLNFLLLFWSLPETLNVLAKKMTLIAFVFLNLRTPKTRLHKCLKSPASEDPSENNMVNVPKHRWNLDQITWIIFIDHWQGNFVWKSLSYWHDQSWDCLLTHCLLVKSILFLIGTI